MNELALFAGAGGGILGGKLLGWRTVCAVEWDAYAASILVARQNDGHLPPFPIWDDVQTFDGNPWRGIVDVVSGGFPCQDLSTQGAVYGSQQGLDGERSGLWREFFRILGEVRPAYAFIENSPVLAIRGLDRVLSDLASMGYDARWGCIGANATGMDHKRERIWIVADCIGDRLEGRNNGGEKGSRGPAYGPVAGLCENNVRHDIPTPDAFGSPHGLAARMDRLKAIGNGQVPAVAKLAWQTLTKGNQ
jgi:DNA (cytosine-5)-methyltransferase 1